MMGEERVEMLIFEILKVLQDNKHEGPIGAGSIAKELRKKGFEIGDRAVRYHLKHLDDRGLTEKRGNRKGRMITGEGEEELEKELVGKRMGFMIGKIREKIFEMTYDLNAGEGEISVNVSLVDSDRIDESLELMNEVIKRKLAPSPLICIYESGETAGRFEVPEGKLGLATVCSITIDGILERNGIPVSPRFGGILEIQDEEPKRFIDAITYEGSSLDPLDVFASRGMTSYLSVIESGSGRILANLREIPIKARDNAVEVIKRAEGRDLDGVLEIGSPASPIYGLPVDGNMAGVVVVGGINPAVAVKESGIEIETRPIEALMDVSKMKPISDYL